MKFKEARIAEDNYFICEIWNGYYETIKIEDILLTGERRLSWKRFRSENATREEKFSYLLNEMFLNSQFFRKVRTNRNLFYWNWWNYYEFWLRNLLELSIKSFIYKKAHSPISSTENQTFLSLPQDICISIFIKSLLYFRNAMLIAKIYETSNVRKLLSQLKSRPDRCILQELRS